MRHRLPLAVLSLAVLIVTTACQYDPYTAVYTTREPTAFDVVGVYGLDERAAQWSRYDEPELRQCRVELRADGSFAATHVPDRISEELTNSAGRWRIEVVGGNEEARYWGVRFEAPGSSLAPAHLSGEGNPYGLIFGLGDPDSGEAILLERHDA